MVYIISHTWPGRWTKPGIKDSIIVYSNCDSVELFNGESIYSLGVRKRNGIGTHFQWDNVDIAYNVLQAVGYVNGEKVVDDRIVLHHLPESPGYDTLIKSNNNILLSDSNCNYIYRVNCGGPDYIDSKGNLWRADQPKHENNHWGSTSWTDEFPDMPPFYASQRRTFDPIANTNDEPLFQTFRYGRNKLKYEFELPNGIYRVEFYFIEPWYGTGGNLNCEGWRIFDVAINGKKVIDNLDIWENYGHDKAVKINKYAEVENGRLTISFPEVLSGQAIISAIAIATPDSTIKSTQKSYTNIKDLSVTNAAQRNKWKIGSWMDLGDTVYAYTPITFSKLSSNFFGTEWLQPPKTIPVSQDSVIASFVLTQKSEKHLAGMAI